MKIFRLIAARNDLPMTLVVNPRLTLSASDESPAVPNAGISIVRQSTFQEVLTNENRGTRAQLQPRDKIGTISALAP